MPTLTYTEREHIESLKKNINPHNPQLILNDLYQQYNACATHAMRVHHIFSFDYALRAATERFQNSRDDFDCAVEFSKIIIQLKNIGRPNTGIYVKMQGSEIDEVDLSEVRNIMEYILNEFC